MRGVPVVAPAALAAASELAFAYPLAGGRGRDVLRGVNLALRPGELVALVGVNGSGKTTLLRLLSGVLSPTGGELGLFGRPVGAWSRMELAARIAVLPQGLELPAGFRVGELVAMGRLPHAHSWFGVTEEDEAAVERALRDADALELAGRTPDELSGGERQRVLLAMALAQEPELLLLDEPTLHLDLAHQLAVLETIRRLRQQRGIAVVAVLHDLALAAAVAPRVAVLDEGRVVADGSPDDVLTTDLIRRVFGVQVEELVGADGTRHLVVVVPGSDRHGRMDA
jgi:iron complex transport system ATP-binding protein